MINLLLLMLVTIHAVYSIKNGSPTLPGEFNYIASIHKGHFHHCSGVIIHEQHIITVAHRIAKLAVSELTVVVGMIAVSSRWAERKTIKEVYLHPNFDRRSFIEQKDDSYYEHDIAVLRLEQKLIWTPFVSRVSLVDREKSWGHHLECILISWNAIHDGEEPLILTWELIKLMDNEVYQRWASYLGQDQKFFSDPFGTAAIGKEDLGSPLICGNLIAGLVVEGEQSEIPEKPSIVMSIAPYLEFIDDIVHDGLFAIEHGQFPYIAAIWCNGIHVCGGFIVDDTHVATAGNCLQTYEMRSCIVGVGDPPQWFSLVESAFYPNYRVKTTDVPLNWYINHDFALLTLEKPILWNEMTAPLPLAESDDFHMGQVCDVLRWGSHSDVKTGAEFIKLMTSRVIILGEQCFLPQLESSPQFQEPSFWGKSQYLIPIADHKDIGNPIICDGKPVGFLIQAIPFADKTTAVLAKFLKIRPYIGSRNSS